MVIWPKSVTGQGESNASMAFFIQKDVDPVVSRLLTIRANPIPTPNYPISTLRHALILLLLLNPRPGMTHLSR